MFNPFGHKAGCDLKHAPGIGVGTRHGYWAIDRHKGAHIFARLEGTLTGGRWLICRVAPTEVVRTAVEREDKGFWSCDCCGGFISQPVPLKEVA